MLHPKTPLISVINGYLETGSASAGTVAEIAQPNLQVTLAGLNGAGNAVEGTPVTVTSVVDPSDVGGDINAPRECSRARASGSTGCSPAAS
jgi:hypothetical protein